MQGGEKPRVFSKSPAQPNPKTLKNSTQKPLKTQGFKGFYGGFIEKPWVGFFGWFFCMPTLI